MLKYILPFSFIVFASTITKASETIINCPTTFQTTQSVKGDAPSGWVASQNRLSHSVSGITVFDGPPKELASLVPDNEEGQDPSKTYWKFAKNKDRSIWLQCHYFGTGITLEKELPKDIQTCFAHLEKKSRQWLGLKCQ